MVGNVGGACGICVVCDCGCNECCGGGTQVGLGRAVLGASAVECCGGAMVVGGNKSVATSIMLTR